MGLTGWLGATRQLFGSGTFWVCLHTLPAWGAALLNRCAGWLADWMVMSLLPAAAYNDEVRTTLLDKRLQEVLLSIDGAANREQVGWSLAGYCTQQVHNTPRGSWPGRVCVCDTLLICNCCKV